MPNKKTNLFSRISKWIKKTFPIINPDIPWFDWEGMKLKEIVSKDEKAREKIKDIFVKEFAQTLERNWKILGN